MIKTKRKAAIVPVKKDVEQVANDSDSGKYFILYSISILNLKSLNLS